MKKRVQLSLEPDLITAAKKVMAIRKFSSLSEFTEALIREEWERRNGPVLLRYPGHRQNTDVLNDEKRSNSPTKTGGSDLRQATGILKKEFGDDADRK